MAGGKRIEWEWWAGQGTGGQTTPAIRELLVASKHCSAAQRETKTGGHQED